MITPTCLCSTLPQLSQGATRHQEIGALCKFVAVVLAGFALIVGLNTRAADSPWLLLTPVLLLAFLDASQRAQAKHCKENLARLKQRLAVAPDKDKEAILHEASLPPEDDEVMAACRMFRSLLSLTVWPFYLALAGGMAGWLLSTKPVPTPVTKVIHTPSSR